MTEEYLNKALSAIKHANTEHRQTVKRLNDELAKRTEEYKAKLQAAVECVEYYQRNALEDADDDYFITEGNSTVYVTNKMANETMKKIKAK